MQNTPNVEQIVWEHFISNGYSQEQTAGILGNLWQENKFSTDGDGIAQWLGQRLIGLQQRGNHTDLTVQLDYMIYELNGTESYANTKLKSSNTVESATIAFQNYYERCNPVYCNQPIRINKAIEYYYQFKE